MALSSSISKPEQPHVAVFAFPFGSHPISLLSLVRKLACAAPQVQFSFFNTAKSNASLFHSSSSSSSSNIPHNLKPCSVDDGVPVGHVLSGNPLEEVDFFLKSSIANFTNSMNDNNTNMRITCLLSDAFVSSCCADVAEHFGVPWIAAWLPCSPSLSAHLHTHLIRQHTRTNHHHLDFIPGLSEFLISDLPGEILSVSDDDLQSSPFLKTLSQLELVLPKAVSVVVSSYEELNPPALDDDLRSKLGNVLDVGFFTVTLPLPPLPPSDSDPTGCLSWLDAQKPGSVAYISFGTVSMLPQKELVALAEALEDTKVPFLWSLKDHLRKDLPSGFSERTKTQGKFVGWAPQKEVLSHDSVGVFLTHFGTNSVYEGVVCGVPLIGRPFFGDQHMMGRLVQTIWKDGLILEGPNNSGELTKPGVKQSLELILGLANEEHGKKVRQGALALKRRVLQAHLAPTSCAARDFKILVALISK
ncbi:anthocyanidin 3-O-glucosyltransferase 7 [Ziziphus jujuba]|uniref:Anthocyanidin 3-O-glucosyltransferase 7 n=2 Tax=Ziziphus jujuba TaxID=326968 RepID=A0A6P3ZUH5_ZIZJJ|nr:anthocyanidin 3-O-glucosyltransferase 7 [Ziziphus jujuba]KAH7529485.1 hypothetical protein FEM48_Zijuj05G0189000 [Ziziphus jujuba var. spinosa]